MRRRYTDARSEVAGLVVLSPPAREPGLFERRRALAGLEVGDEVDDLVERAL